MQATWLDNDIYIYIGLVGRVFTNGPGDLGSIPSRVIPKTLKMVFDTSLLITQHYKVRIEVKWSKEMSSALPTPRCSSKWKGTLLVALDNSRQHAYIYHRNDINKLYTYHYIVYICIHISCLYIYIYNIYIYKKKLSTLAEGDPKALFSIATTPRCRERRYSTLPLKLTL